MSAPPQVQAHNFAKAMRTDIIKKPSSTLKELQPCPLWNRPICFPMSSQRQKKSATSITLTLFIRLDVVFFEDLFVSSVNRPELELFI
jgi:hypothetical protein